MPIPPESFPAAPSTTDAAATAAAGTADSDLPIADDLPCLRCGYNLRTRRPSENCPECNLPVRQSIEFERAYGTLPLAHLGAAALFFLADFVLRVMFGGFSAIQVFHLVPSLPSSVLILLSLIHMILMLTCLVSAFVLLARVLPKSFRTPLRSLLFVLALILFIFSQLASLFSPFVMLGLLTFSRVPPVGVISYGATLLYCVSLLVLQVYAVLFLLDLARRPQLRWLKPIVIPLYAAMGVTLLVPATQNTLLLLQILYFPDISLTPLYVLTPFNLLLGLLVCIGQILLWWNIWRFTRNQRHASHS